MPNAIVLIQSSFKGNSSLDLSLTLSISTNTFDDPDRINPKLSRNEDSWAPTPNESYQRYSENLHDITLCATKHWGTVVKLSSENKQHMTENALDADHQNSEEQKLRNSQADKYLSTQSTDMALQHKRRQEVYQYRQKPLCQQMQHQQIRDPQQHELQQPISHEQNRHHHQKQQNNQQIDQRQDEQKQQQLISYLHLTSEQNQLQQLQQNEYHQQHHYQQQRRQTDMLLTAQQQQNLITPVELKRLNLPTSTSIDDLITDEFSEGQHATYKL
ncbi:unnamed protein product [Ceratitis capitata]|uniref:(Mediterranean fruit fly) hypothetical protein n=1 Tax=Ceratitis capitata TaxID=7213 RepID=A0A811URL4_CERCA|nr:unnamed protein product [Ceratitis capitata]